MMFTSPRLICALSLALLVGCGEASGGGPPRDDVAGGGSGGNISGTGGLGGPVVAQPMYFDANGNPVTTVYDANGNPVMQGSYTGALYDATGAPVFDRNGLPASWGGSGATDGGLDLDNCAAEGAEAEVGRQGADIIWIVDNSCSMAVEAAAVQANMNTFATTLVNQGIDVHLVLISFAGCPPNDALCPLIPNYGVCIGPPFGSGVCPADSNPPNYLHLNQTVGSNNALQMLVDLYPQYAQMLRPNAVKHFAVITDDTSSMTAADFTARMNGNGLDNWFFHGIFSKTDCPDSSGRGVDYDQLVTQTGGVSGDLCLQEFDPVFAAMAVDVAEKADIACDWPIPEPPQGQTLDLNKVNVEYTTPDGNTVGLLRIPDGEDCNGREGWYYDDPASPTQVISCPVSCEGFQITGGAVDVLFGCDSVLVE